MKALIPLAERYASGALPMPLTAEGRLEWQEQFNAWPVMERFALQLDLSHATLARFTLEALEPFHLGGVGDASKGGGHAVNGAILAGMFDGALGVAGVVQLPGRRAATVDLSIKMFRAVTGPANAFSWAIRKTSSIVFVEAVMLDQQGARCAHASGIVCATDAKAPGRGNPAIVSEPCPAW
jgi:acyl-coenzyme A thioesterase PaaI-like protein